MQQSNGYIIGFAVACTIILGAMLSGAAVGLKETQDIAKDLDTKKQILGAVMEIKKGDNISEIYAKRIKSLVVDADGSEKNNLVAEKIDIGKEYKKEASQRVLPVFQFVSETDPNQVEAYILPVYGNGLWDRIWGYLAVSPDLQSIKGVVFDHKAETPGLGARISDKEIQERYVGKKLYDNEGKLVSVTMLKGEKGNTLTDHTVDGMSGATLTGKGVNDMLYKYLSYYQPYLDKVKKSKTLNDKVMPEIKVDSTQITTPDSVQVADSTKKISMK